jgi:hypothetical protein
VNRTTFDEVIDIGIRLSDDAYMVWWMAQRECAAAQRTWFDAEAGRRAAAHVAYQAALDREEAAARDLERLAALTPATPRPDVGGGLLPPGSSAFVDIDQDPSNTDRI